MANGGGKTVVAVPPGASLDDGLRTGLLHDVGDVIASLDGRYATGPDVGTSPRDMAVIAARTSHVFCLPAELGGSGDSSPHTAAGVAAAIAAVCARLYGTSDPRSRRLTIVGLGSVGGHLARQLAAAGAELLVSDIDPARKALAAELGATWASPREALTAPADVLVPAALGGVLTRELVPALRCAAVVGPANNQLAEPSVAGLLHERGIVWVPDYVAGAGGVIYALGVELHKLSPEEADARVLAIGDTVGRLLADPDGADPAEAALRLASRRLRQGRMIMGQRR